MAVWDPANALSRLVWPFPQPLRRERGNKLMCEVIRLSGASVRCRPMSVNGREGFVTMAEPPAAGMGSSV